MFGCGFRAKRAAPVLGVSAFLWLAGTAAAPAGLGVAAPQLAVGDHWQYQVTDNLRRGAKSQLDVSVVAVTDGVARIRLERTDASGRKEWINEVDSSGSLRAGSLYGEPARPFNPPAQLFLFPLDQGKTWRQTIDTLRKDTGIKDQILIYGKVNGRAPTAVPAGSFDAISARRTLQFDDAEFWRSRTTRTDLIWYAPAVKAPVREKREAEYVERGGGSPRVIRTESTLIELVSFQAGGK
jgi:hypothetical protein